MKTNNNPTSGKRLAQLLALCLLATFSSCDRDGTESVEFGVNVQTPDAVYAGQPVTFEFDGNPDYIAFYSGEKNDRYANRDRTTLHTPPRCNMPKIMTIWATVSCAS